MSSHALLSSVPVCQGVSHDNGSDADDSLLVDLAERQLYSVALHCTAQHQLLQLPVGSQHALPPSRPKCRISLHAGSLKQEHCRYMVDLVSLTCGGPANAARTSDLLVRTHSAKVVGW